jgi:hypothetical protein
LSLTTPTIGGSVNNPTILGAYQAWRVVNDLSLTVNASACSNYDWQLGTEFIVYPGVKITLHSKIKNKFFLNYF